MPKKIDHIRLQELLEQGLNQVEIARIFGVTKSSVCKAIKRHRLEMARAVTASEAVPVIVEGKIDIMKQIKSVNETIHCEIDWIKKTMKDEMANKDRMILQDQMLKYVAEVRKQMRTVLDVAKTLYNAEEVQVFMEEVIKAIEEADPATKDKILLKLQEARPVRRSIQGPESI